MTNREQAKGVLGTASEPWGWSSPSGRDPETLKATSYRFKITRTVSLTSCYMLPMTEVTELALARKLLMLLFLHQAEEM